MRILDKDKNGNRLEIFDSGVYLTLIDEKPIRRRKIFTFRNGKIFKKIDKRNIFQKTNKVGFNYNALIRLNDIEEIKDKSIHVIYNKKTYKIPIDNILEAGDFLHFKSGGFELQCFYPLSRQNARNLV